MEWKIFGMEWKWNGRKLPVWNMEKSSSIPHHALRLRRHRVRRRYLQEPGGPHWPTDQNAE